MPYHFLDHTADVKFQASGEKIEDAFISSAEALNETIYGKIEILPQTEKQASIQGTSLENLFYKFLEEFLFLLDAEQLIISGIENLKIDKEKFELTATLKGDKAENYKFTNDVKAITYNEMFVKFNAEKNQWETQGVFDV